MIHSLILLLVAALHYGVARTLDCGQRVGGTGDNTCPRMIEDDPVWRCLSSVLNCSNGQVYHCLQNEYGEWTEVCAKEEMCEKGKEPMVTNAGNIVCRFCDDRERYNPEKNTLSNKFSQCPNKKTICKKEINDRIECKEPYDKDPYSKFKMDRLCRCSYEENMVPKSYEFGRDTWTCSYPEVMKCWHLPCPMTENGVNQTRGRDYKCYPVEAVSQVTPTLANRSETIPKATVEDNNKRTSHILGSTTKKHTTLLPSEVITKNTDVPPDGPTSNALILVSVVVVAVIMVVVILAGVIYNKKHKAATVMHKTTINAQNVIQTEKGQHTFNFSKDYPDTESLETNSPRFEKDYQEAKRDEISSRSDICAALLHGSDEKIDENDDIDIQQSPEKEGYSSVEIEHAPLLEKINNHVINKCKEDGKVVNRNIGKTHRRSHSQGIDIFNSHTVKRGDSEIKIQSSQSIAVISTEKESEVTATSLELREKYKRVLDLMTMELKQQMDPESVLDSLKKHGVGRPNNYMNINDERYTYTKNGMIIDLIKGFANYKKFKLVLKDTNHDELLAQINKKEALVLSEAGGSSELSDDNEDLETSAQFSSGTEEQHNGSLNGEMEDNTVKHFSSSRQLNVDDAENNKDTEAKRLLDSLVDEPWEGLVAKAEKIENEFLKRNLKIPEKTATCIRHLKPCQKSPSNFPHDLEAFESSPNGDCLYNSVSKVLYGDERAAYRLRLATVLEGVKNCKKYIKQHSMDWKNGQELKLYMESVLTDDSLNKLDSSRSEDLDYLGQFLIRNAVFETIKPGSYSSKYASSG